MIGWHRLAELSKEEPVNLLAICCRLVSYPTNFTEEIFSNCCIYLIFLHLGRSIFFLRPLWSLCGRNKWKWIFKFRFELLWYCFKLDKINAISDEKIYQVKASFTPKLKFCLVKNDLHCFFHKSFLLTLVLIANAITEHVEFYLDPLWKPVLQFFVSVLQLLKPGFISHV